MVDGKQETEGSKHENKGKGRTKQVRWQGMEAKVDGNNDQRISKKILMIKRCKGRCEK